MLVNFLSIFSSNILVLNLGDDFDTIWCRLLEYFIKLSMKANNVRGSNPNTLYYKICIIQLFLLLKIKGDSNPDTLYYTFFII